MASENLQKDLAVRHGIEEQFHDKKAISGQPDFYGFGALDMADNFLWESLGNLSGKRLLEVGCGNGDNTLRFARAGAFVTAIDISGEMVNLTKKTIEEHGLSSHVEGVHVSVEEIDFPPDSFDVIYGHSVLHHLNLDIAMPLMLKSLKRGGIAAFLEPLDHNPILNTFRKLTPHRRTPTEQPLTMNQVKDLSRSFSAWDHREFYLLSLASFIFYYGFKSKKMFQAVLRVMNPVDQIMFRVFPFLRRFAWVTVVRYKK